MSLKTYLVKFLNKYKIAIGIVFLIWLVWSYYFHAEKMKCINNVVGSYQLDLEDTPLGVYAVDSAKYKNLTITFKSDLTFKLNMQVPFILDTVGTWDDATGDSNAWNYLHFKFWDHSNYKPSQGDQFTSPFRVDSVFYINACAPQRGKQGLQQIYFQKLNIKRQ